MGVLCLYLRLGVENPNRCLIQRNATNDAVFSPVLVLSPQSVRYPGNYFPTRPGLF